LWFWPSGKRYCYRDVRQGSGGRAHVSGRLPAAVARTIPECSEYIPSKLYEYIWTTRPIIALTYQNPQLDQLVPSANGYVAHADQPADVQGCLSARTLIGRMIACNFKHARHRCATGGGSDYG